MHGKKQVAWWKAVHGVRGAHRQPLKLVGMSGLASWR